MSTEHKPAEPIAHASDNQRGAIGKKRSRPVSDGEHGDIDGDNGQGSINSP